MSYDLKTYFKNVYKRLSAIPKCLKKHLPLRLIFLCDVDIDSIPTRTIFLHPFGICINQDTKIGKNCDIRHGATLGRRNVRGSEPERIILGDNVLIGCNASILGNVRIGNNVIVGAHALVLKDVPDEARIKGVWK